MTLEVALALLSFSAPVTAAIIVVGKRARNGYVKQREFDRFEAHITGKVCDLDTKLDMVLAVMGSQR